MFRPSRNFKVPQVYGGQWKNHQTFMRWDPASKRLVQVNCCAPSVPPPVGTVDVVGVGSGANTLLYSTNGGLTWTGLGNSIFTIEGYCAVWNGTMWVAGGAGTNTLAYSYDGINWTGLGQIVLAGGLSTLLAANSIVWDGICWTATNLNGQFATSYDGINWVGFNSLSATDSLNNASTDGRIVVGIPSNFSFNAMGFAYSPPNLATGYISDANLTNEQILSYTDLLWDESKFILTVGNRSSPVHSKFYSTDGRAWTGIPNVSYVDGTNLGKTTGNLYISRGTNPDSTEKSTDGLTWTSAVSPSLPVVQGIKGTIFGTDTRIFVCGYNNNSFAYTTDGTTWTSGSTGVSGNFTAGFYKYVPTLLKFRFTLVSGTVGVDPGSGNFTINSPSPPTIVLQFNKTDANGIGAADFLSSLCDPPTDITLKIVKDPNNYIVYTLLGTTDDGTYRTFTGPVSSSAGVINTGDVVDLLYA